MLKCVQHRNIIAKLILSSHQLNIETGRHRNIARTDRKCELCETNDIEDEYHFVMICPVYRLLRIHYIPRFYYVRPSMANFLDLLNCSNANVLNRLAVFCIKAFKQRQNELNYLY